MPDPHNGLPHGNAHQELSSARGPATPRFELGRTVITPGALARLDSESVQASMRRHHTGDWGNLDEHDRQLNDEALRTGEGRLFSAYTSSAGVRFWVITEADRSATTVLLPEEY